MLGKIVLYAPYNANKERVNKLDIIANKLAKEIGLTYEGPIYRNDTRICIYYEDRKVKVYIYIDDFTRDVNFDKVENTLRLMSLIAFRESFNRKIKVENSIL